MTPTFSCGHPKTEANSVSQGGGRLVCATCKAETNRRARMKHRCFDGQNLTDPNRADKVLRRFSWEAS